jgi:hypothetical protein
MSRNKALLASVAALSVLSASAAHAGEGTPDEYNCGSNDDEITLKHEHVLSDLARTTITLSSIFGSARKFCPPRICLLLDQG